MAIPTPEEIAGFVDDTLRGEVDPNGTGAYNSRPGSDNAALVSTLTKVAMKQYAYAADRKAASITASAVGADLDDHIRDVFKDERKQPSSAVGTAYLKRTGGLLATQIDQGSRFGVRASGTQQAIEFEARAVAPAGAGVSAVAVPIRCLQEGSIGKVDLAAIVDILDPLSDPAWTLYVPMPGDPVLNGSAAPDVIGGDADEETDDEVKARLDGRSAQVQPATKAGVVKAATDVPGVASAVAIEVGDGTGVIYAGDQNLLLPEALGDQITTALEDWRTFGVPVRRAAFHPILVSVSASVYMQQELKHYDRSLLLANAIAAVKRYFTIERKRPEEYFLDAIKTAIAKANSNTQSVALTLPTVDVRRPTDANYGAVGALDRYYVQDASISINFFDPLTS